MTEQPVITATAWLGWPVSDVAPFDRFATWLRDEAIPAGGLGPHERERVEDRHVLDSLFFAAGWNGEESPSRLVDLGSGVGLPAVPLALLWPDTEVIAVERSGKRVDLLNRLRRILSMENLTVIHGSIADAPRAPMVTMRAVLPRDRWDEVFFLIEPDGVGVVALPADSPDSDECVVVPPNVTGRRHVYQILRPT